MRIITSYVERMNNHYLDAYSKIQSLEKYKNEPTTKEYDVIFSSLCRRICISTKKIF